MDYSLGGPGGRKREPFVWLKHDEVCPVCGCHGWCGVSRDGRVCFCNRKASGRPCGSGFIHVLGEGEAPGRDVEPEDRPDIDWSDPKVRYPSELDNRQRAVQEAQLGLPRNASRALTKIGWNPDDKYGYCLYIAETNHRGVPVGVLRRHPVTGKKLFVSGGRRGLYVPPFWFRHPGPAWLVEGATDTMALTAAGMACVGRPSNTGGVEFLVALFREYEPVFPAYVTPDREIIVVGENDRKTDGSWPGKSGAIAVARKLAAALDRPVGWTLPPPDAKDCREWLASPRREEPWPRRGELLSALLRQRTQVIKPTGGRSE